MLGPKKTYGIVRELDNLGRIVIPKETRDLLGIRIEDPVEFFSDESSIIVRKYRSNCCIFCFNAEDLLLFHDQLVCRGCLEEALHQSADRPAPPPQTAAPSDEKRRSPSERLELIKALLQDNPNLRQHELARMLGISQGYVSQLLSKLEQL